MLKNSRKLRIYLTGIMMLLLLLPCQAQDNKRPLTLEDALVLARQQSRDAVAARNRFLASYWEYRTFKTQYLPMLNLNTTLPSVRRSLIKYTTSEGNDIFVEQKVSSYSADFTLSKILGYTGGQIFVRSGLEQIDNFTDTTFSTFLSNPVTIGFSQPVLAYNPYRWDNKIQPVKYEEAKRKYLEQVEQININAINTYFNLLQAQLALKIAETNFANYDTIYKIAQGRYNLGKIAENELLQLELSYLNSRADVETSQLDLEMNISSFKSYFRLPENSVPEVRLPSGIRELKVDVQKALAQSKSNRSDVFGFERTLLEAESAVHQARLQNRFNANLYAEYGLTQSARDLEHVYQNPQDGQVFSFGIQIPVLDWGLARGKIKMAESNRELIRTTVEQQRIDFDQEIYLKVMQFNMQQNQLMLAAKADTVSQKRYYVTKQRYLIGRIDITDLNIAQTETDNAQLSYINALRNFWKSYYDLRRLTLYDFMQDHTIEVDFRELYK